MSSGKKSPIDEPIDDPEDLVILCQLNAIVNNYYPDKRRAILKVLRKKDNVNCRVPDDEFFQQTQPQLIGGTALHIALDKQDLDSFRVLLERKVDFTITDKEGKTVLHRALEKSPVTHRRCWELKGKLEHPFVHAVLSAHVEQNNLTNSYNKFGISNVHAACMINHAEAVEFFVEHGIPVDLVADVASSVLPGYTTLHFAARYGSVESAEVLISLGADIHQQDAKGLTALHILIERTVEILNYINVQKQVLCEKLKDELNCNRKMIRMIFDKVDVADGIGLTALHIACILQDVSMAKKIIPLISLDNFVYRDSPLWAGYTSLHFAALAGMDIVKLLLKHGASIAIKDAKGVTPFDLCVERYIIEDVHFMITSNPLWNSIRFSDDVTSLSNVVLALHNEDKFSSVLSTVNLNVRIPSNSTLWPGYTILHLAILFCDQINKKENIYNSTDYIKTNVKEWDYLLKLFKDDDTEEEKKFYFQRIKQILNINADLVNLKDAVNSTPLHLAFRLQNRSVLKLLLKFHEKITNIVDNYGLSHFHIACAMKNEELAENLLNEKADVNCPMPYDVQFLVSDGYEGDPVVVLSTPGWTPLHIAVITESFDLAPMLLKYGADANALDADGLTPIHRILQLEDYGDLGETVLRTMKDLQNCATFFGLSYLHVACAVGDKRIVRKLLDHGADIEATYSLPEYSKDTSDRKNVAARLLFLKKFAGHTPLYIATLEQRLEVVHLLIKRGANIFAKNADSPVLLEKLIISDGSQFSQDFLWEFVRQNKKFQNKLKKTIGLTQFHIECLEPDLDEHEIGSMLDYDKADANERIHSDSPVWAQRTPLHFLIMNMLHSSITKENDDSKCSDSLDLPPREKPSEHLWTFISQGYKYDYSGQDLRISIEHTLQQGGDVTLADTNKCTPIHLASELFFWDDDEGSERDDADSQNNEIKRNKKYCRFPYYLVAGQKNYGINPVDIKGISHFHVACICDEVDSVEKFLKNGVDVNGRVGFFGKRYAGFTPLHLAAYHKSQGTVKLLLKYGADVHARDSLRNTPLHVATERCPRYSNCRRPVNEDIFELLIEEGAPVDSKNLWGETPLGVFVRSGITFEGFKIFVRAKVGCVNIFDQTGYGLLANILQWYCTHKAIKNSHSFKAAIKDSLKSNRDSMKRTVIHNIVSTRKAGIESKQYTQTIQEFIEIGFNVDQQDKRGWTALHVAVHFRNYNGIVGLLENGADINISDLENKSAISLSLESPETSEENRRNISGIFLLVAHMMTIAGLKVSTINKEVITQLSRQYILHERDEQSCQVELNILKAQKVDTTLITWFDLLSHTKPALFVLKTRPPAVTKIFENPITLREKFPAFGGLLIMQYRKAIERIRLREPSEESLKIITGLNFPAVCSDYVIQFLSNKDLKHLVKALK